MSENKSNRNSRTAVNAAVADAPVAPSPAADPRRWAALIVLLVATFMDAVDVTVVNIAVPHLQADTGASTAQIQWVVGGYALAFALGLITGGRLGDLFGRKRVFLAGVAGFTLTSLVCGIAGSPEVLLAGRIAQGAAAAMMVPQVLSIIHVSFPKGERGKVFGVYGAVTSLGVLAGPLVGALLVEGDLFGWGWRPIFLVNLPLGVIGLVVGAVLIRESKAERAAGLDVGGMLLSTVGLLFLVLPLIQGRELGWPVWTYVMMAASVPVLALFVAYERRVIARGGSPLVVLSLFSRKSFSGGLGVQLLFGLASGVFFLAWALYLQLGLGFSPLKAGLSGLPLSLLLMVGAGVSMQVLVPRFGRRVLQTGALIAAAGMGLFAWMVSHYGAEITLWQTMLPLVPMGIGMGLIVAPLADIILSEVPHEHAGSASGLNNTTTQLGQAVGTALSSLIFFNHLGGDNPVTQAAKMPDAFAHTLPYVGAAFLVAFAVLFAVPRQAGRKYKDAGDSEGADSAAAPDEAADLASAR
ncbi:MULTISPECIES: MFS transporter [unclassified Streptomyces]|uniref:MFS transporter n=1 Tax=unclassified Streptomyces TaxID=2593676 RepID=UPI0003AABC31|nr:MULTISPECIES: MFS transporter [unclassified Streptomyces]MYT32941.1 DHA2 family efflux MFS transporter permease subunit [Streptomyces sp. SID8354]